jgi:hypothetical protein
MFHGLGVAVCLSFPGPLPLSWGSLVSGHLTLCASHLYPVVPPLSFWNAGARLGGCSVLGRVHLTGTCGI